MNKLSKKNKIVKRAKTQKNFKCKTQEISISLKPFEEEFSKELLKSKRKLKLSNKIKKREMLAELKAKFAPTHIKANNNYFDYINYLWMKNVSLEKRQKYIVQIDDFRLAQDKVYQQLDEIIRNYIKTHSNKLSKNLSNYYYSVVNGNPKSYTRLLARREVDKLEEFIKSDNLWALLAYYNSDEMTKAYAPLSLTIMADMKNSQVNQCYIYSGSFNILDMNVYSDYNFERGDRVYKQNYKNHYRKFVKRTFDALLGPNHGYNPDDVFNVEQQIYNTFICNEFKENEDGYNKISSNEALEKYSFDWHEFSKYYGFKTPPKFFITGSQNYLKCCSELMLKNWKSQEWKTFWLFITFKNFIRITKAYEKIAYEFNGKFQRGQQVLNESNAVSASLYMSVPFDTFLTNEYVAKYEDPKIIKYTETLVNDIRIVFKKILMRNNWLQPSTKNYALKKLDAIKFIFSKPPYLREDPDLNYTKVLYDNMKKIHSWRHERLIDLVGKHPIDVPEMDWTNYPVKLWGNQAYIVNASYTPIKNSIYLNLGHLQKPFIDLDERGIEYNLASMGYTIAHELGHSLDDSGSKFDLNGNLYNWWTDADKKYYKKIQDDVIKQYEEYASRDNIKFDASISIGEDLADIQGLAICEEYLRDFQEKNEDIIPIRELGFEAFYTYFAMHQKQVVGRSALKAQLKTNPHPLDKYRCNVPLSRSEIFRSLYNVKKGDGMWWHNTNMVW